MNQVKTLFIVLLLGMITPALAQKSEESIRAEIQYQMNQRHPSLPAGFWERLGVDAIPVIKKMYTESTNANERSFFIDGLAHFSDSGTSTFLESEVNTTQNEVLKKKLLRAVIQSEGERSFEFVEPYLKDGDGHIRLAVAQGLKTLEQTDKIQKRLAEFLSKEKTAWVLADYKKTEPVEVLQKTRKNANSANLAKAEVKVVPALPEKSWAGLWRGSYITESKVNLVEANLTLVDSTSVPMKWKVEYKLPNQIKQEWKSGEFVLIHFQTNHAHWIELRNEKMDIVFLAQRKVN